MKKINMIPMCNEKTEYKKFVLRKYKVKFFVFYKNKSLFFSWPRITFLLLRDNRNILLWHNILNNAQNNNSVLHEK